MPSAHLPHVILVGGPDVDSRIELMRRLGCSLRLEAAGSSAGLRQRFLAAGFGYHAYPLGRRTDPTGDLRALVALAYLFRRARPQIVHTFDTKPGVLGCLAARVAGVPVVIGTITGLGSLYSSETRTTRLLRRIYQPLQMIASRSSDLTVFQNRDDLRQFVAARVVPASKTAIVPGSGVPTAVYDPALVSLAARERVRKMLGVPSGAVLVTMVARAIRSKGVVEFAEAARRLRSMLPTAQFLLVGQADGDSVDRLTEDELTAVREAVTWAGPQRDVRAILAASDIFALPSYLREGVPRALLEAASMALPLVSSNTPGCNDVVEPDINGLLVPPRDPGALAEALRRLIDDQPLRRRMGEAARRRAVAHFDIGLIAAQFRAIYLRLLETHG